MVACFLSNISAKYYKNPSMLSRVIAKNVGDVFFETRCISVCHSSLYFCLFVHHSLFFYVSVCLSVRLSVCVVVGESVCLSVHLCL